MGFCWREKTLGGNRWRDARLLVFAHVTGNLETETQLFKLFFEQKAKLRVL